MALGGLSALFLPGCGSAPEVDQIAQARMIGLSKRHILACFGRPSWRRTAGQATEIWTYAGAEMRGYGPQWAILRNTNLPPFAWPATCEVKLVMTNGRVSQVAYAAADGQALPLGQECIFLVEQCVGAP
jgi:hypothetical protein